MAEMPRTRSTRSNKPAMVVLLSVVIRFLALLAVRQPLILVAAIIGLFARTPLATSSGNKILAALATMLSIVFKSSASPAASWAAPPPRALVETRPAATMAYMTFGSFASIPLATNFGTKTLAAMIMIISKASSLLL